jgi:hypothetical protein
VPLAIASFANTILPTKEDYASRREREHAKRRTLLLRERRVKDRSPISRKEGEHRR